MWKHQSLIPKTPIPTAPTYHEQGFVINKIVLIGNPPNWNGPNAGRHKG